LQKNSAVAWAKTLAHNGRMCPRYFRSSLLSLCWLVLAQSAAQPAQTGQSNENQSTLTVRANTRLVVVDVVATDNKGEPVTGLKPGDFIVQEDGTEQEVQVFSFHQPGSEPPAATGPFAAPGRLPRGVYTNVPQYRTGGALNVLLVDALNSNFVDQAAARDAMLKFLEKLPAGEPVAIYLLGNKLTLIQDFTSDPEMLKKAIAGLKQPKSRAMTNAADSMVTAQLPMGSAAAETVGSMPGLLRGLAEFRDQQSAAQADVRVSITLDALNALARSLAGYPGRKNLIWVSETIPITIAVGRTRANSNRDYSAAVERTENLLSNAQVAIYTVDSRAIAGSTQFNVAGDPNPISAPQSEKQTLRGEAGAVASIESDDRVSTRSTMNDLAEKTGGRAFYNTNNLEGAVRKSIEDGSTYYTLGYYPANKNWDGKFRRITVKTERPGVKLHYRQGYFAIEPQSYAKLDASQKSSDLAQALSLSFPVSTALRFQAAISPPSAETKNKVLVNYAVDPRQISFELQSDGLQHASIDCAVIIYSQKGEALQTLSNTMNGSLKPEEYQRVMERSFPCRQTFDLGPGEYLLRLGVRDTRTGLIGTLDAPLTIPTQAAGTESK